MRIWERTITARQPSSSPSSAAEKCSRAWLQRSIFERPPEAVATAVQQHAQVVRLDVEHAARIGSVDALDVDEQHRHPLELGKMGELAAQHLDGLPTRDDRLGGRL